VYGAYQEDGKLYMVMEYMSNSLRNKKVVNRVDIVRVLADVARWGCAHVQSSRHIAFDSAWFLEPLNLSSENPASKSLLSNATCTATARALVRLHAAGHVHRDVKVRSSNKTNVTQPFVNKINVGPLTSKRK
jgi:serine/threonine protein kinase